MTTSPHASNATFRSNLEMAFKAIPLLGVVIYLTGYLIRLTYFRSINISSIEFLKAQCFESGVAFFVLSTTLLAILCLPALVLLMHKQDRHSLPTEVSMSMVFSLGAFGLVIITALIILFFMPPQHFPLVRSHFTKMLIATTAICAALILLNILARSRTVAAEYVGVIRAIKHITDFIRLGFLVLIAYYSYEICFRDVRASLDVFVDLGSLTFLFFLTLFAFIAGRLLWRCSRIGGELAAHETVETQTAPAASGSVAPAPPTAAQTQTEKSAADATRSASLNATTNGMSVFLLLALSAVLYYLTIVTFCFGPFVYIPTSRGGGLPYNTVRLVLVSTNAQTTFPFVGSPTNISSSVYLLSEQDTCLYVAEYRGPMAPRHLYRTISTNTTYAVERRLISGMMFDKLP